jgi:hypothetical protein
MTTALRAEVDKKRREISSDNLSMSIGEMLNLYRDEELDIHPEFQRVFRWVPEQKSRLIESVLLGIPLPPIYVATNESGVWEVVDGVQRLSTLFEFMGELSGPPSEGETGHEMKAPLVLEGTKHLPQLAGVTFESLDSALKLEFKRARLDVKILGREEGSTSGPAKFDLFERLNTYGTPLSPQELRNCILVSLNAPLYLWLKRIAEDEHFRSCTLLSDTQLQERYDMDLALRFVALRHAKLADIGDVHDFLRDRMEDMAVDPKFDRAAEERVFRSVFKLLDESANGNAFRPWNRKLKQFRGAFSLAAYEGLALNLGKHWPKIAALADKVSCETMIKGIWATPEYTRSFSGLRARERMARVMPPAEKVVLEEIRRVRSAGQNRGTKKPRT